jgi:hypothetical protein
VARRSLELGLLGLASALAPGCSEPCVEQVSLTPPPEPNPGPDDPAIVIDGEWIADDVLELQFSRPLTPTDPLAPLDPGRFAVLGWTTQAPQDYYSGECSELTEYAVVGPGADGRISRPAAVVDAWVDAEAPARLRVQLGNAGPICQARYGGTLSRGVTLVYTDGGTGSGRLTDADGEAVASLGPQWALASWARCLNYDGYAANTCALELSQSRTGLFPHLAELAPIPCFED